MQIILLEDIRNLGKIGEVVKVKDGYGRNFLLRKGKALRANKENIDLEQNCTICFEELDNPSLRELFIYFGNLILLK